MSDGHCQLEGIAAELYGRYQARSPRSPILRKHRLRVASTKSSSGVSFLIAMLALLRCDMAPRARFLTLPPERQLIGSSEEKRQQLPNRLHPVTVVTSIVFWECASTGVVKSLALSIKGARKNKRLAIGIALCLRALN